MANSTSSELLLCYNKGCGKQFNPADNREGKELSFNFDLQNALRSKHNTNEYLFGK